MNKHNETVMSINNLISLDKEKIDYMESELKDLSVSFNKFSPELKQTVDKLNEIDIFTSAFDKKLEETFSNSTRNSQNIKEIVTKVSSLGNRLDDLDGESDSSKHSAKKLSDSIESI